MSNAQAQALHSAEFWVDCFCREVERVRKDLLRVAVLEKDASHLAPRFLDEWEGFIVSDAQRAMQSIGTAHGHLSFILNAER